MHSKRIRFGFLVLAVYATLGVVGVYSQSPTSSTEICPTDIASIAASAASSERARSSGGGSTNVEWHSFLPGAFK